MLNEAYQKHGYRIVKTGSGNYIVNPTSFKPRHDISTVFEYKPLQKECGFCIQTMPDHQTLRELLEALVFTHGQLEFLEYH